MLAGAHFLVYHYAMGLFVIALTWYFMAADRSGLWLPRTGMEINQLLLWIFYLLFLAPLAIVGWTEPDPPAE